MSSSFPMLNRAMGVVSGTGVEPTWGEVMQELWPVISSPLSPAGERLLLEVIHHNGSLCFNRTDELPHSLSPEEMLKSLAVQALARWTRLTYLTELRRLEIIAQSSALKDVIRAVIQMAMAARSEAIEADAISEQEPSDDQPDERLMWLISMNPKTKPTTRRFVVRPVGRFGNLTIISGERVRSKDLKQEFEFAG